MHLCRFLDDAASDHLYSLLQIFSYINFNILIHAPAKGATYICDVLDLDYEFQSTLPRRERQRQKRKSMI